MNERNRVMYGIFLLAAVVGVYAEMDHSGSFSGKPVPAPSGSGKNATGPAASSSGHTAPKTRPAAPIEVKNEIGTLDAELRAEFARSDDPWAVALSITVFAPGSDIVNQQRPVQSLLTFASQTIKTKEWVFPVKEGTRFVQRYPDALVAMLLEARVPGHMKIETADGPAVMGDIWAPALLRRIGTKKHPWTSSAWTFKAQAFRAHDPAVAADQNLRRSLDALASQALSSLESAAAVLTRFTGGSSGDADTLEAAQKNHKGIYAHSEGGYPLLQAVFHAVADSRDKALIKQARRQLGVLMFRIEAERDLHHSQIAKAESETLPDRIAALVLQAGALETITLGQRLLSRPKEQKDGTSRLTHAADLLAHSLLANLVALRAGRAFDIVYDERQKKAPYLDLLEARCRALRGLRLLSAR
ncbi:MAG: hypothetical protein HRU17_10060 [Polyangiaceae bacterium]|nr:hypothetical protein [Polyangiaceae bacterium]